MKILINQKQFRKNLSDKRLWGIQLLKFMDQMDACADSVKHELTEGVGVEAQKF